MRLTVPTGRIERAAAVSMAKSALQRRPGRFAERARQEDGPPRAPKNARRTLRALAERGLEGKLRRFASRHLAS